MDGVIHSISVVPLANEQLRVPCIDPQISLQDRAVNQKKKLRRKKKETNGKSKAVC